ncbi:MAG: FadR/GntR family transcriptional regulator [Candidatus Methylomirabilota bacterium]
MVTVNSQDFHTVRKSRISEGIIEQVQDLITSGRLAPGDRLPSERELARILDVGRSTVREAIRTMESIGVVKVRAGEGTFLVGAEADAEAISIVTTLLRSWDSQRKLFEVRRVIEPDLAGLAARRATPEQIAKMRGALATQTAEIAQGGYGMKADSAFHTLLAEAAGNEILVRIMDSLMERLQETRASSLRSAGRPLQSLEQHRAILKAVADRNARVAEKRMMEHLRTMEALVFSAQVLPDPASAGDAAPPSGGATP